MISFLYLSCSNSITMVFSGLWTSQKESSSHIVDHSGEAQKIGLRMPPTKLLIFGNPKAGTPVMLATPTSAIDLPLRILIWEDSEGKVWVSYNSSSYLMARHNIPPELLPNITVVESLAESAIK